MNYLDTLDQIQATHTMQRKNKSVSMSINTLLLDGSVLIAYVLYGIQKLPLQRVTCKVH